jgi:hypothetical protein
MELSDKKVKYHPKKSRYFEGEYNAYKYIYDMIECQCPTEKNYDTIIYGIEDAFTYPQDEILERIKRTIDYFFD